MRFGNLEIRNFLSLGDENHVDLRNRGLMLIEGVNCDDPSAKSNGSGKSSIVDALSWCLFGKTARGVSGDDVVNRTAKKNCKVEIEILEDGERYRIVRYRKDKEGGNGLQVFVRQGGDWTELTKGTVAETQRFIEGLMGCSHEIFVTTVYAGQDAMPDLPSMTDKQLKGLIESVLGITKLSKAYAEINASLNASMNAEEAKRPMLRNLEDLLEETKTKVYNTKTFDCGRWTVEHKIRIQSLENDLRAVDDEETVFNDSAIGLRADLQATKQKIEELRKTIEGFATVDQERNTLRDLLAKASTDLEIKTQNYKRLALEAQKKCEAVKNIETKVGTPCSECGKLYTLDDLAEAKRLATESAVKAVEIAKTALNEAKKAKSQHQARQDALTAFVQQHPDNQLHEALTQERMYRVRAQTLEEKLDTSVFAQKRQQISFQIERLKAETNPYLGALSSLESLQESTEKKLKTLEAELQAQEEKTQLYKMASEVLGPKGVRAHILDTITPLLNDRTARYLDVLSDGKLRAVWTTLTTTKKGELRENFQIMVQNMVGGGSFDSLSGGEKRKVRVACCLALQEVVASRATKPIELFIADEVDHALDEAGVERLIGVLEEKAQTCKTLLVISHNPLRNWIDNVMTVKKKNGISSIVEE